MKTLLLLLLVNVSFAQAIVTNVATSVGTNYYNSPMSVTPALWTDGLDPTTIVLVSSAVSQWSDKSGNNRHYSQATAGSRPIVSGGGILFNTAQFLTSAYTAPGNEWSILYVAQIGAIKQRVLDGAGINALLGWWSSNEQAAFLENNPGWHSPNILATSGIKIVEAVRQTSGTFTTWWNGTQVNTTTASYAIGINWGMNSNPSEKSDVTIYEYVVFPYALTVAQREKEEGRLAHKWNTTATLPVGHTFKTNRPLN